MSAIEGVMGYDGMEIPSAFEGLSLENSSTLENLSLENVDYIQSIEGLHYGRYEMGTLEDRMRSLRTLEARLAEIQGRPPVKVVFEEMEYAGYYDHNERCLHVNIEQVKDPRYRLDVIDTIAHEGQHALQHFAVEHPELFPKLKEVIPYWRANMDNAYFEPKYIGEIFGPEFYYNQPLELNAWERGAQIQALFGNKFEEFDNILANGIAKVELGHRESLLEGVTGWIQDTGERLKGYFQDICSPTTLRNLVRIGIMSIAHHRV